MKVLSCDLSLTGSAFALSVFDCGEMVHTQTYFVDNKKNAKLGHGFRLKQIADQLAAVLKSTPDIDVIVREKGFSRHAQTTQALFKVVGVSDLIVHEAQGKQVEEISPTTVKKELTGSGKASKEEVEQAVRRYLPDHLKDLQFKTDDESDAVAVGIAWAKQKKVLK